MTTLNELIRDLEYEKEKHGDSEIGWDVGSTGLELLIGEDPDTGSSVTIDKPEWG